MAWAVLQYSRNQVDKAGDILINPNSSAEEFAYAFRVLDNWRASHNFPLNTLQMRLRLNARKVDPTALMAQRLKRVESIVIKLSRFKGMKLSRMQDIGGCRAVVGTVAQVNEVRKMFEKSRSTHQNTRTDDYVASPKEDGYRGIHLVYRYQSSRMPQYNGHRIEIQLRSRLMHAWATAVETAGTFIRHSLKSDQGPEDWKLFFKYMGSVFALTEKTETVPGSPEQIEELRAEVARLESGLRVSQILNAYRIAESMISDRTAPKYVHFYLLTLETEPKKLSIRRYTKVQQEEATRAYLEEERRLQSEQGQAVLVSVDSIRALRRAYPNYFGDTRIFLGQLRRFLPHSGLPPSDAVAPVPN